MLTLFNFEGKEVRFVGTADHPEWIAKDVCMCLGLSNVSQALSNLDEIDKGISINDTPSGKQKHLTVYESGLYELIFLSRTSQAKAFKRWIVTEVLPSIRKTGQYTLSPESMKEILRLKEHESGEYAREKFLEMLTVKRVELTTKLAKLDKIIVDLS
jgi:prophage antirepressor-like protein